eukprot:6489702-Amphidinium_carterae.1
MSVSDSNYVNDAWKVSSLHKLQSVILCTNGYARQPRKRAPLLLFHPAPVVCHRPQHVTRIQALLTWST